MDSNQEVNSMYRDIDLNMPCFEEEELSSDVESTENHFSSLIQNNATPQLSQGMNISYANNFEVNDEASFSSLNLLAKTASDEVDVRRVGIHAMIILDPLRGFTSGHGRRRYRRRGQVHQIDPLRFCTNFHCRTRKTPMWRTGPLGPKTLCNACGIYYNKHLMNGGMPAAIVYDGVPHGNH